MCLIDNAATVANDYDNNNVGHDDDDDDAGVPVEHPELGLEARWWHSLPGRVEARVHRSELSRSRLLDADGKPLHDALLQTGR